MLSRRQFVMVTVFGAAHAKLTRSLHAHVLQLRVGTITDAARPDLESGLTFGAAEANRSALLFGWMVEREQLSPTEVPANVHALIVSRAFKPPETPLPTLDVSCSNAESKNAFHLTNCQTSEDVSGFAGRRVELWHHSLERFGADALNNRYRAATGADMTSDAWLGWFSMKVITEAALRARSSDPSALLEYLRRQTSQFDGHKGAPLRFDSDGLLRQPVYLMRRNPGNGEWVVEREIR